MLVGLPQERHLAVGEREAVRQQSLHGHIPSVEPAPGGGTGGAGRVRAGLLYRAGAKVETGIGSEQDLTAER